MSESDTCKFGHTFNLLNKVDEEKAGEEFRDKIKKGEISSYSELKSVLKDEGEFDGSKPLAPIMGGGDYYKRLKVSTGSQGAAYNMILGIVDSLDDDFDYDVSKTSEQIHVSPQSRTHAELMERKTQAEANVRQSSSNIAQLKQQKHALEHDIRKLRKYEEALQDNAEGDEQMLKSDWVQTVDGAQAGGQGQGDEGSIKFLQSQNIYPSITADFHEMRGIDDLKPADESEYDNPRLSQIPDNEKAVLRKKYAMYDKWKDLFGSQVKRRLNELKQQLTQIETAIEETEDYLEQYVSDAKQINQASREDLKGHLSDYFSFKGYATLFRDLSFIAAKPLHNEEGTLVEADGHATHYQVIFVHGIHVNLSGSEQVQSPAEGPSSGTVMVYPALVCKHVYENIVEPRINERAERLEQVISDYTDDFEPSEEGKKLSEARNDKDISVRELRQRVDEESDSSIPLDFSATIRRVEDGLESPAELNTYSDDEDIIEIVDDILGTDFSEDDDSGSGSEMYSGVQKKIAHLIGIEDEYNLSKNEIGNYHSGLHRRLNKEWYVGFKKGLGLYAYS